jgi:uncharacterized protein YjiS (DUF1127 family)
MITDGWVTPGHRPFMYTRKKNKMPKIFKSIIKKYKNYKLYARTVNELSVLSDKELKDIGMSRSEIKSVAARQYIRKAK